MIGAVCFALGLTVLVVSTDHCLAWHNPRRAKPMTLRFATLADAEAFLEALGFSRRLGTADWINAKGDDAGVYAEGRRWRVEMRGHAQHELTDRLGEADAAALRFIEELCRWWPLREAQDWDDREEFITQVLPKLLADYVAALRDDQLGLAWWNRLTEQERGHWLRVAGSARLKDAWEAFKRR